MNILDPLGTRSPRPFDLSGSVGAAPGLAALRSVETKGRPTRASAPSPTPIAPVAGQQQPAQLPASTGLLASFDPSADPIVQQVHAFGQKSVQQAQAAELAGRKQTLIDYGYDPALGGLYPDESTASAARQNPFSFLANLAHNYGERTHNLDEGLNKSNLFYSSTRGKQLGENARDYQAQQAGGATNLRGILGQLAAAVLATQGNAAADDLSATGDAYRAYKPPESLPATSAASKAASNALTGAATPATPGSSYTSSEQLPIYAGQPFDEQILADLARPFNRRAR